MDPKISHQKKYVDIFVLKHKSGFPLDPSSKNFAFQVCRIHNFPHQKVIVFTRSSHLFVAKRVSFRFTRNAEALGSLRRIKNTHKESDLGGVHLPSTPNTSSERTSFQLPSLLTTPKRGENGGDFKKPGESPSHSKKKSARDGMGDFKVPVIKTRNVRL